MKDGRNKVLLSLADGDLQQRSGLSQKVNGNFEILLSVSSPAVGIPGQHLNHINSPHLYIFSRLSLKLNLWDLTLCRSQEPVRPSGLNLNIFLRKKAVLSLKEISLA